jgi:uncharacterized damage-inducible protein DinB
MPQFGQFTAAMYRRLVGWRQREGAQTSDNQAVTASILADAFAHHAWATVQLIDACMALEEHQLRVGVPGVYGSILETLRHLVGSDCSYLRVTSGEHPDFDPDAAQLQDLRDEMTGHAAAWADLLGRDLDPDAWLVRNRPDGSQTHAPLGIRLAQALHHGTDHRSQVCTILSNQGVEPPAIDVWDYGLARGRTRRTMPAGEPAS